MGMDLGGAAAARREAAEAAAREAVEAAAQRLADAARRAVAQGRGDPEAPQHTGAVMPEETPEAAAGVGAGVAASVAAGVADVAAGVAAVPAATEPELGETDAPEAAAPVGERPPEPLWGALDEFAGGLGAAALGLGGGLRFLAANPLEAVRGMATLAASPARLAEAGGAIWEEARAGGWAHAAGYVAGSAAPLLLGPGGAIAIAGMAAERLAASPLPGPTAPGARPGEVPGEPVQADAGG